jgi:hypothetical protein
MPVPLNRPRTAADILASAQATPQPRVQSLTQGSNYVPAQYQSHGLHLPSSSSTLHWRHTPLDRSGLSSDCQDSSFISPETFPVRLPLLGPAINDRDDSALRGLNLGSKDTKALNYAVTEPPSAGFTGFASVQHTRLSRLQDVLTHLRLGRLSPIDLLIHILDPQIPENDWHRIHLYKEDGRLAEIMDTIMADERGRRRLGVWMKEHAV